MATKHLSSKGQTEVVQPLPQRAQPVPGTAQNAPSDIANTAQNAPSDVTDTESQLSAMHDMEPVPDPVQVQRDMEHVPVRRSEQVRRPVVRLNL